MEYRNIGYILGVFFIGIGLFVVLTETKNITDNVSSFIDSCHVMVTFLAKIFFWVLLGLGIIIIAKKTDLGFVICAGIFFVSSVISVLIVLDVIIICN